MKNLSVVLTILFLSTNCFGQQHSFFTFNTSRFARTIGLGNAFTGLADDIEAVYYNSAGLANFDYYGAVYSKGQGFAFIIEDYTSDDFALILPIAKEIGIFAFSIDRFLLLEGEYKEHIYRLHFARQLFENFSLGTSINHYRHSMESLSVGSEERDNSAGVFDISLSALFKLPITVNPSIDNETRFGFQFQNLIDSDVRINDNTDSKHQTLRVGLSTAIIPKFQKQLSLMPLKFIIVADAVFYGGNYKFDVFQPNFGLELALFEILKLRYGRENEIDINNSSNNSPQHPAKRYGIGLSIPLHKFIPNIEMAEVSFDYGYSDWDKIDESKPMVPSHFSDLTIRESFTIKVYFKY
jgi:hypothetical protein